MVIGLVMIELMITIAATWVYASAFGRSLEAGAVPAHSTVVVFGSLVRDGEPGDPVRGRLDTALTLYRTGHVDRIINSGNGSAMAGDEPAVMRAYLEARGVPAAMIVDDGSGVDTAATCSGLRDRRVRSAVLVTQDFHLGRAIALCRAAGVDATGVRAACDCPSATILRNHLRENLLANPRALLGVIVGEGE